MLSVKRKQAVIEKVRIHDKDTGSSAVQVGLLSTQIDQLAEHLKKNKKDHHSRRGLLKMVAERRTHLKYLQKHDQKSYELVAKKLGLK